METGVLSASQLIQYITWAFYIVTFVAVAIRAIRQPLRANIDMALLFGSIGLIIGISVATSLGIVQRSALLSALSASALLIMSYMLLRLVDDFSDVPRWLMLLSELSLVVLIFLAFAFTPTPTVPPAPPARSPIWLVVLLGVYLLALLLYTTLAFLREARRSSGVTKRRMRAVAVGSMSLFAIILLAEILQFVPWLTALSQPLTQTVALVSGIGYLLGFAPPAVLRRAWQEPELRAFLGRAATLPRLPDTESIVREMERGAAASLGASNASIGLWDEEEGVLRGVNPRGEIREMKPTMGTTSGRAFLTQKPIFSANLEKDSPEASDVAKSFGVNALMVAPITAGEKRLGVLAAFSTRAPIFADEDLALVKLLADQAAVILESRALIDEAARVRAREEVTRLKEDFLSAAAHDLKTPLTTMVAQAQLLERRLTRNPEAPVEVSSVQKLVKEAQRLRTLVLELLDAARTEQGRLVGERTEVDLVEAARETCARHDAPRHPCTVEAEGAVTGLYDPNRVLQLVENLVENAVKYSPDGGAVRVKIWHEDGWNRLTVTDHGIGIPPDDLPHLFDRFHRGTNVDDRRFAGMGLGLFICRGIAEQHGGRIWATSTPGKGSTFHVDLPDGEVATMPAVEPEREQEVVRETTPAPMPIAPDVAGGHA